MNADCLDAGQKLYDPRDDAYETFNGSNIAFFERYFGLKENLFAKSTNTPHTNDELTVGEEDLIDFVKQLLSNKKLMCIDPRESKFLRQLAERLYKSKKFPPRRRPLC